MQIYCTTRSCTVHITGYDAARMDTAFGPGQPRTDRLAREPFIKTAPAITYSTVPTESWPSP